MPTNSQEQPPIIPPPNGIPRPKGLVEPEAPRGIYGKDAHAAPPAKRYPMAQLYTIGTVAIILILTALVFWTLNIRDKNEQKRALIQQEQQNPVKTPTPKEPGITSVSQ